MSFFFNDTATTEIYTLSLHDALPISPSSRPTRRRGRTCRRCSGRAAPARGAPVSATSSRRRSRSEEHTSELQSRHYLVCRLLLEKKQHFQATDTFATDRISCISEEHH